MNLLLAGDCKINSGWLFCIILSLVSPKYDLKLATGWVVPKAFKYQLMLLIIRETLLDHVLYSCQL